MNALLKFPRPASCPANITELFDWLERGHAVVPGAQLSIGETEPGEDARGYPWIKTDSNRNPLGTYVYSASKGKWLRDWGMPVGALLTVYSSAITVSADRENKGLVEGWELADGNGVSGVNLTSQTAFFTGTSPAWTIYTLVYIGHGD